jgi:DNA-binding IclR family transcriptional regulator
MAIAAAVCDKSDNIAFTVSTVMIRGDRGEAQVDALGEAVRDLAHRLESVLF